MSPYQALADSTGVWNMVVRAGGASGQDVENEDDVAQCVHVTNVAVRDPKREGVTTVTLQDDGREIVLCHLGGLNSGAPLQHNLDIVLASRFALKAIGPHDLHFSGYVTAYVGDGDDEGEGEEEDEDEDEGEDEDEVEDEDESEDEMDDSAVKAVQDAGDKAYDKELKRLAGQAAAAIEAAGKGKPSREDDIPDFDDLNDDDFLGEADEDEFEDEDEDEDEGEDDGEDEDMDEGEDEDMDEFEDEDEDEGEDDDEDEEVPEPAPLPKVGSKRPAAPVSTPPPSKAQKAANGAVKAAPATAPPGASKAVPRGAAPPAKPAAAPATTGKAAKPAQPAQPAAAAAAKGKGAAAPAPTAGKDKKAAVASASTPAAKPKADRKGPMTPSNEAEYKVALVTMIKELKGEAQLPTLGNAIKRPATIAKLKTFLEKNSDTFVVSGEKVTLKSK